MRADEKRILGKDLTVSAVGFGCMGMTHAYGAPSDPKIPGSRKPEHICENLGAADIELTMEEVAAIDAQFDNLNTSALYGTAGGSKT